MNLRIDSFDKGDAGVFDTFSEKNEKSADKNLYAFTKKSVFVPRDNLNSEEKRNI